MSEEIKQSPSFFVDPDATDRIYVDILYEKDSGKIVSASSKGIIEASDLEKLEHIGYTSEWFEFTLPNYDQVASYRQRSSVFRSEAGKAIVDQTQFRRFLIVWHLKKWSLRDGSNQEVALTMDKNGTLDQKSIEKVYSISPALMDVVMTALERKLLLM
jgi:hypothetical protein